MKQIQVDIMADSSEIVHYDIPNIPITINSTEKGLQNTLVQRYIGIMV